MVQHIVLFKIKPDATDEQVDAMIAGLRALKIKIDGVVELTCGRNYSPRSAGHDVGLCVTFNDQAGLDHYAPHPEHVAVKTNLIAPISTGSTAVDYEY